MCRHSCERLWRTRNSPCWFTMTRCLPTQQPTVQHVHQTMAVTLPARSRLVHPEMSAQPRHRCDRYICIGKEARAAACREVGLDDPGQQLVQTVLQAAA